MSVTRFSWVAMLAIALFGFARTSQASDIIYSDNFDGTGGIVGGRTPDTASGLDGGTAGATWTSDTVTSTNPDALWTASGGTYSGTGTTNASIGTFTTGIDANLITNAYLPFTPFPGTVYDFHMAIASSGVGASGNWLGMTFAPAGLNGHTAGGGSSALSNMAGNGLIILKGSGQVQSFGGNGTANGELNSAAGFITQGTTTPVFHTADIILDTTGAQWKVSWLVDGVTPVGQGNTSFTYATNPSIGDVVFGANKLTGVVSDFSLTSTATVVPEPTSLVLAGLGLVGLIGLVRRKK